MKGLELPDRADKMFLYHGFEDDFDHIAAAPAAAEAGFLNCSIGSWQEQDGTALADFSAGAIATPGYSAGDEGFGIRWNNHANPDPISYSVPVPPDLDSSQDVVVHVLAAKVGATLGDAVTWTIEAFFNVDAALYDADVDAGGASSAMTGDAASKTCQEETLTIAAADVQGSPAVLTLTLQPTDGTLGTDDVIVLGVWLEYTKLSSTAGERWSTVGDPGYSVSVDDAEGGILTIVTDGDDNDEVYVYTSAELYDVTADKPVVVEALLQYTEANTDDANILFGLMDAVAADALVDDGAGPKSSYSGAVFFKEDGQTVWSVENSVAGTQKTTQLTAANALDGVAHTAGSASAYHRLRIEIWPLTSTKADYLYYVDGVLVAKHKDQTYTNFTDAAVVFGAKAGGANAETLLVDYMFAYQKR